MMAGSGAPAEVWRRRRDEPLLSDLGEMKTLRRIRQWLEERSHKASTGGPLILGAGDDTALVRYPAGRELALTCDIHLEGRHFLASQVTPREAGRRVMISNLSDLAAMGAAASVALVSMALAPADPVRILFEILEGLAEELKDAGGRIAGGNLCATGGPRVVDVTLVGELSGPAFLRSGARAGDELVLVGTTGLSAAGLWAAQAAAGDRQLPADADQRTLADLRRAFIRPRHRLTEAGRLRDAGGVAALIDTSDGLIADLGHLCESSGVGAEVDAARLPVGGALRRAAGWAGVDPLEWVLGSSDDYALLAAVRPDRLERVLSHLAPDAHHIGRFVPGGKVIVRGREGRAIYGWDHFKSP